MWFYLAPATLTFSIGLQAFLKDSSTPKSHLGSWIFLVIIALLWPVALPSMIWHRGKRLFNQPKAAPTNPRALEDVSTP